MTTVRGEVKESQSASMARAPDFEVHMFQLLFPLPIFFCFWQSVELIARNDFFALLLTS